MDRSRWRKLIKDVWLSGWVWVGECFFWYRPTRVVPDRGPLNGCVRVCAVTFVIYLPTLLVTQATSASYAMYGSKCCDALQLESKGSYCLFPFRHKKNGGRLPLLSTRPAVTPVTLKRTATSFAAWWIEARRVWTVCLTLLLDSIATAIWTQALLRPSPAR